MAESAANHTFHLTVRSHDGQSTDRRFTVPLDASIGVVLDAVGETEPAWLLVERTGKTLLPDHVVGLCDLRNGDVVRMVVPSDDDAVADRRLGASIEILTGPRAGETLTMEPGELSIGRAADNGFVIIDPGVSRFHGSLELQSDGSVLVHDHGSTNGVIVEDVPITGSQPVGPGDRILVGQTWFVVKVAPINELGMSTADGSVLGALNVVVVPPAGNPPHVEPPPSVEFPTPPEAAKSGLFRSKKSPDDDQVTAFRADLEEIRSTIEMLQDIEASSRQAEAPGVGDLRTGLNDSPPSLWRSPIEAGLAVRIGLASLVSRLHFELPSGGDPALQDEMAAIVQNYRHVENAPVVVDFADNKLARILGAPDEAHSLARSVVAQLALRHRPSDLRLMVAATGVRSDEWPWAQWLPHCRLGDGNGGSAVASDPEGARRLLAAAASYDGRVLIVLDGHAAGEEAVQSDLAAAMNDNPLAAVLVIADDGAAPNEAVAGTASTATVEISDGFGTLVLAGSKSISADDEGSAVMGIACEGMSSEDAEQLARALAPMVEPVVPTPATAVIAESDTPIETAEPAVEVDADAESEPNLASPETDDGAGLRSVDDAVIESSVEVERLDEGRSDLPVNDRFEAARMAMPAPVTALGNAEETVADSGDDSPGDSTPDDSTADDVVLVGSLTGEVELPSSIATSSPQVDSNPVTEGSEAASAQAAHGSPSRSGFFGDSARPTRGNTAAPPPQPASGRRGAEQTVIARTWESSEGTSGASLALGVDPVAGNETVEFDVENEHLLVVDGASDGYLAQLVAGLAVTQSPFKANLVMLDALGGRMLATCDRLPHTVASVIKPTPAAMKSALAALAAELDRREALVATLGCDTMADLRRSKPNGSVPHLVVVVSDPVGTILTNGRDAARSDSVVTVEPSRELAELARRGAKLGVCMIVGRAHGSGGLLASDADSFAGASPTVVRLDGETASVSRPGSSTRDFTPSPPRMAALNPDSLNRLVSVLADVFRSSGRPEPVSLSL